MDNKTKNVLVFDIGKTHVKVSVLSMTGDALYQNRTSNRALQTQPYHSYDVDGIWGWFKNELSEISNDFHIASISIATHGAAAAMIDSETGKLLLPIMDYEFDAYPDDLPDYLAFRPKAEETGSPLLPAGLNLGRQLNWQCNLLSPRQKESAILLMYPQFWAWKLSDKFSTEITSLGCHTDLWNIKMNTPSSLLLTLGLESALPPLTKAWNPIGTIKKSLADECGLSEDCLVYPGVHDSNAGYIPILRKPKKDRPTVVSTGTWSIVMDCQSDITTLDASRDMLINIDAEGSTLATARYMGGREFGLICERLNTDIATTFTDDDIEAIINSNTLVMPSFCHGTGPYPGKEGMVIFGDKKSQINGKAAATIYSALMVTDILKRLSPHSQNDILVEGSFASNSVLCGLISALNPERTLRIQNSGNGVTEGCFLLTQWGSDNQQENNPIVPPYRPENLERYVKNWNKALHEQSN